jgi:hypothetical protein
VTLSLILTSTSLTSTSVPVTLRYVYTPVAGDMTLRHHSISSSTPPGPTEADIPSSLPGALPAGGVTSSLTDGDEYWPTPTTAPTFSGFDFMFWSVAYTGTSSVPNYYLTQQSMPYPVKISGSAVQIWAWYTPTGGSSGPYTPQVWIDAFDVSVGNFSNDPKVVTVSPDPGGTLTANANSQGVVPTSSSSENILAYSKLMDGAVFESWGYIFGPTTPPVTVDTINPMQLDASQNAGTSGPAYWLAFYKAPPKHKDKELKEKEWRVDKYPWEEKAPKESKDAKETGPELPSRTMGSGDWLASSATLFDPSDRIDGLEGRVASGRSFIRPEERPRVQGPSSEEMKS